MAEAKRMVTSPSPKAPSFTWVVSATPPLAFLLFSVVVGIVIGMPLLQLSVLIGALLALVAVLIVVPLLQKKRYREKLAAHEFIDKSEQEGSSAP